MSKLGYNLLVPMRWMSFRSTISSLTSKYHLSGFLTELRLPAGSKLVGSNVVTEQVSERFQMNVLEIIRQGRAWPLTLIFWGLATGDSDLSRGREHQNRPD